MAADPPRIADGGAARECPGLRRRSRTGRITGVTETSAAVPRPPLRRPPLSRRIAAPAAVLAGVATAFAYVGTVDPNVPGHYPVCPLLKYTGLYCPGCGGLRSAYAVVHGDLVTALGCNALAVAGYAVFTAMWVTWLTRTLRGLPGVPFVGRLRPGHWWALGVLVLAFAVVRNLPFGAVLAP
jgi:hypothetical protein